MDLFFPVYCVNCSKEGEWLCEDCEGKINYIKSSFCAKCNTLTEDNKLCEKCRRDSKLKGVFMLGYYNDEILKKAIWDFKYSFIKEIGSSLSLILAKWLKERADFEDCIFVAVPLDKKRQNWRGFNQSEILALETAQILSVHFMKSALKRVKNTKSQIGLTRKERIDNISGAFAVNGAVKDKKVFLVDDVITTGSTLEECAKELKAAGAKEVWGVVLAKD